MHVCVLGSGIVGLATAWQLQRMGHQVTVIDQASPGAGASGGNGAQLSYSYVQPLADPSIWLQLPKLLLSPQSPLKLQPQLDTHQWRWGLAFLAACNTRTSHETTRQLLTLAASSRQVFEQMCAELQPGCDFAASGKLVLYTSAAALAGAERQMLLQRGMDHGGEQRLVSAQECTRIEPSLRHYQTQIAGAIYTPGECAADCLKLCTALAQALLSRGVRFLLNTTVTGFDVRGQKLAAAQTSGGDVQADAFVMALGSASHSLARALGAYVPVYPLKGYSITMDLPDGHPAAPTVSVTDSARKVVFARIGSRLRVAGMAELVGNNTDIRPDRIKTLVEATRAVFPDIASDGGDIHPWTGMRPATPTGRPILGPLPGAPSNMHFNTGHGALGFTLAFGSALRVAQGLHA